MQNQVEEALKYFPVVLITGARQVGKSTLAQELCNNWPARYLTLDNRAVLDTTIVDPDGFIDNNSTPLVIDEIQ